jgi:hypothetical protein
MGLSLVHTNRTMQSLRRDGLIAFQDHEVVVLDWQRLQAAAEFDPIYLQVGPGQRIPTDNYPLFGTNDCAVAAVADNATTSRRMTFMDA